MQDDLTHRQQSTAAPFSSPAITLPKGGGAIRGIGEKFAANPVTGTGSISIPLATTPGRSGFGPRLSLAYDSGSGNGPFGFGWSLSLPAITRKTEKGLPEYRDAEESDVYVLTGAEDLVPVIGPDSMRFEDTGAPGFVVHRYRPRVEGLFARIERWTNVATSEIHWRSISQDNVTTLYGTSGNSRIFDPGDLRPAHPTRVFSWLICMSYDDKGNAVVYEYAEENADNLELSQANERNRVRTANRYLKRVKYGNRSPNRDPLTWHAIDPARISPEDWLFEVVFDYDEGHHHEIQLDPEIPEGEQHRLALASPVPATSWVVRPDAFSSYRAGFEVRAYRRCRRLLMFHHVPDLPTGEKGYDGLVRGFDFDYDDLDSAHLPRIEAELGHQGSTRFGSVLRRVVQSGYVRDNTQPLIKRDGVEFATYLRKSLPPLEFEYSKASIDEEVRELDAESVENLPVGLAGSDHFWVDLDGEGVSGVLTEVEGAWFYKPNLGEGRLGALRALASQPSVRDLGSGRQQLLDLAGDGRLDHVTLSGATPGFHERTSDESWGPFRAFRKLPNLPWDDPNLRFVDLNGDGRPDVLITEEDALGWHSSLGEDGFGPTRRVRNPVDDERGPRLVFADGTISIHLADMSGDGLTDLVRIRNGEVCYWPNVGYGRFGAKVTMDDAPLFDDAEQFDQRRVRLTDIDGSGTTDIVYLARDGVRLYYNQAGNRLTEARRLARFPSTETVSSVTTVDLLGNGTACLVWSSPLPAEVHRPMRYVDLTGGTKPHLLIAVSNNLGAETHIHYAPSTRFSLADKRAGNPWMTRLPFPVHVVERVETFDRIGRSHFVTCYAYHHGYFDGAEREFRGFGMVEQWDTEELAVLTESGVLAESANLDAASHVPAVMTRTWFHTGAWTRGKDGSERAAGRVDGADESEYYREPGLGDVELGALLLPDTVLPAGLEPEEEREASRALTGSMLRQETYALDGSDREHHPYTVAEQNVTVRLLQPQASNRHGVFFVHPREAVFYHYEREPGDPRVSHTLTLEVDEFGNVLRSGSIGYGRRRPDPSLSPAEQGRQGNPLMTYSENRFTSSVESRDDHRTPVLCEARTYHLTGIVPANGRRLALDEFLNTATEAPPIDYEVEPSGNAVQKRLIGHTRTTYRRDDLAGPLPLGEIQSLALPFESCQLAFTPGLVAAAYGDRVTDTMLANEGRYVHTEGDAGWWIPSERVFFSPGTADTPVTELDHARRHFFLPRRFRDPFHTGTASTESFVTYDAYDLLVQETRDALGNRVTVGERDMDPLEPRVRPRHDYRVLRPALVMDENRNRSEVVFDALGMVAGTASMGKPEDDPVPGDRLGPSFQADLIQVEVDRFLADPTGADARVLLGGATTRVVYDVASYFRDPDITPRTPPLTATITRETHSSEPAPPGGARIRVSLSYSDGFGREIQKKAQAEPGPAPLRDGAGTIIVGADHRPVTTTKAISPRWVGTGWTVLNNKGKCVRRYEPFFTDSHRFEFDLRIGVSPIFLHDPVGRIIATVHPAHTWEKVVFDPWRQETWDVNDTVSIADPGADPDVGANLGRLPASEYLPTWHGLRTDSAHSAEANMRWPDPRTRAAERNAAEATSAHAGTPTVVHLDALGRTMLTVTHNRVRLHGAPPTEEHYFSHVHHDIEGNCVEIVDAHDRVVSRYVYDMLGRRARQSNMDAGDRWILTDVAGKPLRAWDGAGNQLRTTYDRLRRPVELLLAPIDTPELVIERRTYGESHPEADRNNLRGRLVELADQAGVVVHERYDFKGNLQRTHRRFARDYDRTLDWSIDVALDGPRYASITLHDALNREREVTLPDGSVSRLTYNDAGLLEQIEVNLRGLSEGGSPVWTPFVARIDYDALGRRSAIEYGNRAETTFAYDPHTFRLTRIRSRRLRRDFPDDCPDLPSAGWPGCDIQNRDLTYDPVGNVTQVHDSAQQAIFFRNRRVEPTAVYTYDALYRLVEATGREHVGNERRVVPHSWDGGARTNLPHPHDGNAMATYVERFRYDPVGNITRLQHAGGDVASPGWSRTYEHRAPSLVDPSQFGNRLTRSSRGDNTPTMDEYLYDENGNTTRLPHLGRTSLEPNMRWDHRNKLQRVDVGSGTAYYIYDADGERVRKVWQKSPGRIEDRLYLGDLEIYRELNRDGDIILARETLHVSDDAGRVAMVESRTAGAGDTPEQVTRYQLADHLGSSSIELDEMGRLISHEEYAPYGTTTYQATNKAIRATAKRYRFSGKERDEETGLHYYGARYYACWLGRWVSPDPRGTIESSNVYLYARGSPTRFIDPDGTVDKDFFKVDDDKTTRDRALDAAGLAFTPIAIARGLFATATGQVSTDYLVPGIGSIAVAFDEMPRWGYKAAETTDHVLKGQWTEAVKSGIDAGVHAQNVAFAVLPFLTEAARRSPARARPPAPEPKAASPTATETARGSKAPPTAAPTEDTTTPFEDATRVDPLEQLMQERAAEAVRLQTKLQPMVDRLQQQLFDAVMQRDRTFLERYLTTKEGKTGRVDALINATDPNKSPSGLVQAFYGQGMEAMLAEAISNDPALAGTIEYTANRSTYAGGKKPDFNVTSGPLKGWYIDLTTDKDLAAHKTQRAYGERQTIHVTYTIGGR